MRKFRKNEWELNQEAIEKLEMEKDANKWINLINELNEKERKKELSASELIFEMKIFENIGEINYSIRHLLDRTKNGHISLKESSRSTITDIVSTIWNNKVNNFIEWTKQFKKID
jgi:hypothetical protein